MTPKTDCQCLDCLGIKNGCEFCALTGYEDYPTSKIPCRVENHQISADILKNKTEQSIKRPWSKIEGNCPFCKQPNCIHWLGYGWVNPRFQSK